LDLLGTNCI